MKNLLASRKILLTILVLGIASITYGQKSTKKMVSIDDLKNVVKTHKSVALVPFTFAKKEYSNLPDGVTEEIIAESEKKKGLELQGYVHERLAKKNGKYPYQWISIEDANKEVEEGLSGSALAKALGVDAVVTSEVQTPKVIIPDDQGSEYMPKGDNVYGLSGTSTFVIMTIYVADSEEPIWKWKLKLNGNFGNAKLVAATLAKNYMADKFPYKF